MGNSENGGAQRVYMHVGCGSDVGGMRGHLYEWDLEKSALDSRSRSHIS